MLYREIIAVCSEIHAKHINTVCGQNTEFPNVTAGGTVHKVSVRLYKAKRQSGEVVSLTHRPPLPPGMFLVLIFIRV